MSKAKSVFGTLSLILSVLLLAGGLTAIGYYYFGGSGTSGDNLSDYSVKAIAGAMGTPVVMDGGSASKVVFAGLENGGLGGAAFLKVPFVDRYVLTGVSYQGPSSFRKLVLRVDNGTDRFFVSYDGTTLNQGQPDAWAGTYTRFLLWSAMAVLAWAALMTLGALLRRRPG
jgi:hypothetical protein